MRRSKIKLVGLAMILGLIIPGLIVTNPTIIASPKSLILLRFMIQSPFRFEELSKQSFSTFSICPSLAYLARTPQLTCKCSLLL